MISLFTEKCGLYEIGRKKAFAEQTFPGEKSLWPDQCSIGNGGHQLGTKILVLDSMIWGDNGIFIWMSYSHK